MHWLQVGKLFLEHELLRSRRPESYTKHCITNDNLAANSSTMSRVLDPLAASDNQIGCRNGGSWAKHPTPGSRIPDLIGCVFELERVTKAKYSLHVVVAIDNNLNFKRVSSQRSTDFAAPIIIRDVDEESVPFEHCDLSYLKSSSSIRSRLSTPCYRQYSKFSPQKLYGQQKRSVMTCLRRSSTFHIITSAFENRKSSINDSGASEPARALLERLFIQTKKLEGKMNGNSHVDDDVQLGLNLETLESDLQAALEALKKKEEDLQEAERTVMLEHADLNHTKEELEWHRKDIAAAFSKQKKLEDELSRANLRLMSQAREIEDLKLRVKERECEIATVQSSQSVKEEELDKMKNELNKKCEEAMKVETELKSKAWLFNEANKVVEKQQIELSVLRTTLKEKEEELEVAMMRQKLDEEKLKAAEAKLEQQTTQWLLAQEELRKLREEALRHTRESHQTMEDFQRVKKLLADVRSELVSSQNSLVSSRQKMEKQELLLEKQLSELEEQKHTILSYMTSLKDAEMELERKRVKLRVAETRSKELEQELSMEKQLMQDLKAELHEEKSSLQQAILQMSNLQTELNRKNTEFSETSNLLQNKESELVETRLEIQRLKSEQASIQAVLEERDLELLTARKQLEEVSTEVAELRTLMASKEEQLIQVTSLMKEKEDFAQAMQHELNNAKLKYSEAESVVGRIVDLTNKLVVSTAEDVTPSLYGCDMGQKLLLQQVELENSAEGFGWQKKQLESELNLTRENLRRKEMEVIDVQRALTIKDEELQTVLGKLDEKERELKELKEELLKDANDLKKLYASAQESIGGRSVEELAIEKLQLEAAKLEVEAATKALHKLTEMSRELVNKASLSIDADHDANIFPQKRFAITTSAENNRSFIDVKTEVARLSALTERLVQEAGVVGFVGQ
ncbi:hypothetical protein Nepgr_014299 [Nepenthes gracilis]|uniref:Uncharacterized protein n=1 Tax=Nepenthes gracilis TaxID=150966 RepID=A0AAD3SJR7_NEPGR|nr:hypothetical protein Nepgr_014299 [Nepenthes gracilis]